MFCKVLQDNATRSSWPVIEAQLPWVLAGPCMTHVLDLELEDIGKMAWVKDVVQQANTVRKFVRNHQHVLAAFQAVAETMLTKPGETRFATVLIGLDCLKKNREALVATHVREEVRQAVRRSRNQRSTETGKTLEEQYKESQHIVNDDDFWDRLQGVRYHNFCITILALCLVCVCQYFAAAYLYHGH